MIIHITCIRNVYFLFIVLVAMVTHANNNSVAVICQNTVSFDFTLRLVVFIVSSSLC